MTSDQTSATRAADLGQTADSLHRDLQVREWLQPLAPVVAFQGLEPPSHGAAEALLNGCADGRGRRQCGRRRGRGRRGQAGDDAHLRIDGFEEALQKLVRVVLRPHAGAEHKLPAGDQAFKLTDQGAGVLKAAVGVPQLGKKPSGAHMSNGRDGPR